MSEPILSGLAVIGDAVASYVDSKEPSNNLPNKLERQLDDMESVASNLYSANTSLSETALRTKLKLASVSESGMILSSMYYQLKEMYVRLLARSEEMTELNGKLYDEIDRRDKLIASLQEELDRVKSKSPSQRNNTQLY